MLCYVKVPHASIFVRVHSTIIIVHTQTTNANVNYPNKTLTYEYISKDNQLD